MCIIPRALSVCSLKRSTASQAVRSGIALVTSFYPDQDMTKRHRSYSHQGLLATAHKLDVHLDHNIATDDHAAQNASVEARRARDASAAA